jgi:acyl-CoA thioester hydrolase
MWKTTIEPRAGEIDFLGHVNNITVAEWFERARNPLFDLFRTEESKKVRRMTGFPLIMAHSEYDYRKQLYFQPPVEIRTWIEKIGTKSFTVYQQAIQCDNTGTEQMCAEGRVVIVYFDFPTETTRPLPPTKRTELEQHLLAKE